MNFGKLPSIEHVDFTLPPDPPGNESAVLCWQSAVASWQPSAVQRPPSTVYVGATGWAMKEWVGKMYPKDAKPADFLYHYTRQFNTIELNTTHYRIPDAATVQKWYEQAASDFRFCPKVLQTVSHAADLGAGNSLTEQFCEALGGLREKLGCCFIQLPPHFGPERLAVLEGFLKRFTLPLAVEVRHEAWFSERQQSERLFGLLEKYGASTVITDVAGRRDVLHLRLTTGTVLLRFVGNDLHPTDFTRLDAWAERLQQWVAMGLQECYVFTHEPDNHLAPDAAKYLTEKLQAAGNVFTRGPSFLQENLGGGQMSLF